MMVMVMVMLVVMGKVQKHTIRVYSVRALSKSVSRGQKHTYTLW